MHAASMCTSTSPCASFSGSGLCLSTYSTSSGSPCESKRTAVVVSGGSSCAVSSVASIAPPSLPDLDWRSRSSAVKKPCLPRPFWLRTHASKPALWLMVYPADESAPPLRSASSRASSICFSMLMPPLRACEPCASASLMSHVPSPKPRANCFSAPPATSSFVRSYVARFCMSLSVSYARCTLLHVIGSPPRSGWCCMARSR